MINRTVFTFALLLVAWALVSDAQVKKYYVDATGGSDANSGLSPSAAWKTIDKVNASKSAPGDSILFKRGEAFRGSLVPSSGSPSGYVTYSAYGSGNKPKLLGAYDRSSPSDWTNQGGNIWRTKYHSVNLVGTELLPNPDFSSDLSAWEKYDDPATGASTTLLRTTVTGEYFTAPGGARLICINQGNGSNPWNSDIQLFTHAGSIRALAWYRLSFMAKATRSFAMPENKITLQQYGPPWAKYSSSVSPPVLITTQWTSYEIYFHGDTTASDSRITFFLGSVMPNGDTLFIDAMSFKGCDANPEPLNVDVGNLIFNNEQACGVKVWERSDLNAQGKFWYDEDNDVLEMYSGINPGTPYSHIELGLNLVGINVNNISYVVCENLDLRYGTFGFAGTNTHHTIVRNCDVSYIGGADQYGGSQTVRLGNGVQFWNGAHDNIVERCTFDQIYDAAVTAQGDDPAGFEVYNIYFRNNLIKNSEYSFEFWEGGNLTRVHDIYFENNTCLNAGRGWSHSQRPDPNGTHLMFFPMWAQAANVYIRNNIFADAADQCVRWWRKEDINTMVLDRNCWYQSNGLLGRIDLQEGIGVVNITYDYATQWETYKAGTKQDPNSIHSDPLLNSDRTLQASSPCIDAGITLSTVTNDFNGTTRPQGAAYDIGAFEASAWLVAPPTLLAPADNMKKVQIDPILSWKKSPRAQKYSLAVSLTPTFSSLVVTDTSLVDTTKAIGPLQYGTTYYWRVCAKNVGATSDWSPVRSFTTVAAIPLGPACYVSPTGNDSNPGTESLPWKTLAKAGSAATAGVTVFIKQGIYRERLVPVNSGRADAPITFTSYPGDSVTITGKGMTPPAGWWGGMIWIESLKYIKISGLRVTNAANTGIHVETSSFITIEKNFVDSSYSPGIKVHGCNNAVIQGNEVVHACLGYEEECISLSATNIFEIRNNLVHDGMTEGIDVKYGSSNGIVSGNEVYNEFDRGGIYIDAWTEHQYNVEIYDNVCHDNASYGFAVTSEKGGLIEKIKLHHNKAFRNRLWGFLVVGWCGEPNQKYPIHNIEVNQNESYENQIGIQIGGNVGTNIDTLKVYNNLTYHNLTGVGISGFDGPSGEHVLRNVEIVNNTIYGNGTSSTGWLDGGVLVTNISAGSILLRNNILSSNAAYTVTVLPETPSGIVTIDRNSIDAFRNFANEKAGINPVYGVPFFADSLRHNFHLLSTSPCIDNGDPDQKYNDPPDPARPGYALYPASGTIRNDLGAYGGPYAGLWDLRASVTRPQTPALNVPADSARAVSLTPMFSWNGILGAERYRVQLSTSASFASKLVDDSMVTDSYRQVGPLQSNTTYYWRVSATNVAGTSSYSAVRTFTTIVASAVEQLDGAVPTEYALRQNYPNPFNPATTIQFALPKSSYVSLKVYDALGRELTTLVSQELNPGYFTIQWNANVPSGIYFYRLQAGDASTSSARGFVETKKMIVLR
ncbi:MAG: right-handed parallel beta-helix repeat-containing protein [Ignavibacteriales bacterium]|nr:right-handed parallel beta-helix repeat-containing protein [Ignavibacteriales bacterium]